MLKKIFKNDLLLRLGLAILIGLVLVQIPMYRWEGKLYNFRFLVRGAELPAKIGITPNQVSVISIILSAVAGFFFSRGDWASLVIGFVFLQLTYIFDHVDGDIARYRNMSTEFGRWVDSIANKFHKFFFTMGLSIGLYNRTDNYLYLILGSVSIFAWFFAVYISETKSSVKLPQNRRLKANLVDSVRALPLALIVNNIFGLLVLFNMPVIALWFSILINLNALQQIYTLRKKFY